MTVVWVGGHGPSVDLVLSGQQHICLRGRAWCICGLGSFWGMGVGSFRAGGHGASADWFDVTSVVLLFTLIIAFITAMWQYSYSVSFLLGAMTFVWAANVMTACVVHCIAAICLRVSPH